MKITCLKCGEKIEGESEEIINGLLDKHLTDKHKTKGE